MLPKLDVGNETAAEATRRESGTWGETEAAGADADRPWGAACAKAGRRATKKCPTVVLAAVQL